MTIRQDAWSHEDDLLLAETVLRYIREGGTQLGAFEEVGDKLNRTAAACGFRWNAEVRQKYEQAVQLAKKQRKERKRALAQATLLQQSPTHQTVPVNNHKSLFNSKDHSILFDSLDFDDDDDEDDVDIGENNSSSDYNITLDSVIAFLQEIKYKGTTSDHLLKEKARLEKERETLLLDKEKLEKKLHRIKEQNTIIQEDYQALVQIMDRARRMVPTFDEKDSINQIAE